MISPQLKEPRLNSNETKYQRPGARFARIGACLGLGVALVAGASRLYGDETEDIAAVQPFVGESTMIVVKVDPTRIALPDLTEHLQAMPAEGRSAVERQVALLQMAIDRLNATSNGQTVYATMGAPLSKTDWPVYVFLKQTPGNSVDSLCKQLRLQPAQVCVRGEYLVASPIAGMDVERILDKSPRSQRAALAAAFEAVASYPIQVLVLPPDYLRRTVRELMSQLPKPFGGGPSELLTEGIGWAALGVDVKRLHAELCIQSETEGAAQRLAEHLPRMLHSIYAATPAMQQSGPAEMIQKLTAQVKPLVEGSRITIQLDGLERTAEGSQLLALATEAVQQHFGRQTGSNRIKQLLLAMHNYHDTYRCFPPRQEVRDANGNAKLSWRVHILPFIGEEALYKEFHLDEAWDSQHNQALLQRMPNVFTNNAFSFGPVGQSKRGYTSILAPVGDDTVFGGVKAISFGDIRDGSSNTVVLVVVKPELAVPWTAPRDYVFDPRAPASGLQIGPDGRFLAGLADGSVVTLRGDAEAELILRVFQKSDGQPFDWQRIR